ncbi:MAG: hypothetical protein ABI865_10740, partial [Nitrosospira sp.]
MTILAISKRLDIYLKLSKAILLIFGASAILSHKFNLTEILQPCDILPISIDYAKCVLGAA